MFDGFKETVFFLLQGRHDARLVLGQFRISHAHFSDQIRHHFVEESSTRAQFVAVANGPANDPAQHVTTAFITRNDAIGQQEGTGANVVGEHFQRWRIHVGRGSFTRRGLQ